MYWLVFVPTGLPFSYHIQVGLPTPLLYVIVIFPVIVPPTHTVSLKLIIELRVGWLTIVTCAESEITLSQSPDGNLTIQK